MTKKLRLNEKSALFLQIIEQSGTLLCGMEVVQRSGQAIRRGSVFAIASNLESDRYITSHKEEISTSAIPRRLYAITTTGKIVLRAWEEIHEQKARLPMLAPAY